MHDMDKPSQRRNFYRDRLARILTERRCLILAIEDAKRAGIPSGHLEDDLEKKQREARAFRAYLLAHA
jgi:hypothetical protein